MSIKFAKPTCVTDDNEIAFLHLINRRRAAANVLLDSRQLVQLLRIEPPSLDEPLLLQLHHFFALGLNIRCICNPEQVSACFLLPLIHNWFHNRIKLNFFIILKIKAKKT